MGHSELVYKVCEFMGHLRRICIFVGIFFSDFNQKKEYVKISPKGDTKFYAERRAYI